MSRKVNAHEGNGDTSAVGGNVFISDSEDENSDRDTNNGEWSTKKEEYCHNLPNSRLVTCHSKNWYP